MYGAVTGRGPGAYSQVASCTRSHSRTPGRAGHSNTQSDEQAHHSGRAHGNCGASSDSRTRTHVNSTSHSNGHAGANSDTGTSTD